MTAKRKRTRKPKAFVRTYGPDPVKHRKAIIHAEHVHIVPPVTEASFAPLPGPPDNHRTYSATFSWWDCTVGLRQTVYSGLCRCAVEARAELRRQALAMGWQSPKWWQCWRKVPENAEIHVGLPKGE